jgi:hypothetical protein
MRVETGLFTKIPDFDPCDGGTRAHVLCLFEAPGPRAVESGFVSRNNPDQTARNIFELHQQAGLARTSVVLWNIVPWYVGTGQRIRKLGAEELESPDVVEIQ